jgi:hypothetical protein
MTDMNGFTHEGHHESTPQDAPEGAQPTQGSTLPSVPPPSGARDSGQQRHVPAPSGGKDYAPGPIRKQHDAEIERYHAKRNALMRAERGYDFLDDLPHDVAEQFLATHRGSIEADEQEMLEAEGVDPEWEQAEEWDNGPRFSDNEGSY